MACDGTRCIKLAYRGVLIERPCEECDTVNIHWKGEHQYYPMDFPRDVPATFDGIVDAARHTGWPEFYTSDLFRDYQCLSATGLWRGTEKPTRFVWTVRVTGSDIYLPEEVGFAKLNRLHQQANEGSKLFAFYQGKLRQVSAVEASDYLAGYDPSLRLLPGHPLLAT